MRLPKRPSSLAASPIGFAVPPRPRIPFRVSEAPARERTHRLRSVVSLCLAGLVAAACATGPDLATRLATGDRAAEDKARDAGRKPAAVVAFLGVEPGMTVLDVLASGGYYTEVFAEAVGPKGRVYAQNIEYVLKMRDGMNEKALSTRLAGERLPNVVRLDRELDDLDLEPESLDVAFTALNFHDVLDGRGPDTAQAFLKRLREVLKPGGVLGLIDHHGLAGEDALNQKNHRIDVARVLAAVEQAGFVVEAQSDVLRNPEDDRRGNVFAPGIRGHTDRFVLRLRKPS